MDVSDHIGCVVAEGELVASAAERGDFDVDIAPGPGWDMRELVRHLGLIHLWAAGHVAFPHRYANDTDDHWFVTLGPERTDTSRFDPDFAADLTLTATAAELYLLLWNRTPDSSVSMNGDSALIDLGHGNFRLRWS